MDEVSIKIKSINIEPGKPESMAEDYILTGRTPKERPESSDNVTVVFDVCLRKDYKLFVEEVLPVSPRKRDIRCTIQESRSLFRNRFQALINQLQDDNWDNWL